MAMLIAIAYSNWIIYPLGQLTSYA